MPILDGSARALIDSYNRSARGPGYNKIAEEVYGVRRLLGDPLSPEFEGAILNGLMGFGMGITIKVARHFTRGFGSAWTPFEGTKP